jgi:hypothetical protein
MMALHYDAGTADVKVYTEDAISAMKLAEIRGVSGTAVCGTHTKIDALMPDENQLQVVWFDNDNPTVVEHAHCLAQLIANRGCKVVLVQGVQDPKKYTKEFLFEVITNAHKLSGSAPPNDKPYHVLEVRPPNP